MLRKLFNKNALKIGQRFFFASQGLLKQAVTDQIPEKAKEIIDIRQRFGDTVVSEVTVNQVFGGMRGVKGIFYDTSKLDAQKGITFRGLSIPDLQEQLQTAGGTCKEALPEAVIWLLYANSVPNQKQFNDLQQDLRQRQHLDQGAMTFIKNLPTELHPLTQLSALLLYLQKDSKFMQAYNGGVNKRELWKYAYEDSLDVVAKLGPAAAYIYRHTYHNDDFIQPDETLDYGANLTHMLGYQGEAMTEAIRGYLSIHTDHEGGNVSAHATHLVGSALSDPYLSLSAGLNGLAGPLHGLAAQESLRWLVSMEQAIGSNPTDQQIVDFCNNHLAGGQVIPGFGHAVLRETDPRYMHLRNIAGRYIPNKPLIRLARKCLKNVPGVLNALGKVANPNPNVDAHSGVLLYSLGMKEWDYYTVIFAVSRAMGCMSALVWSRIMGLPIERPGSVDAQWLLDNLQ